MSLVSETASFHCSWTDENQKALALSSNKVKPALKKTWQELLHSRTAYIVSSTLETSRKVADVTSKIFSSSYILISNSLISNSLKSINKYLKISCLCDAALLPLIVVNIIKQCRLLIYNTKAKKIDPAIQLIGEIGSLGRSMIIFTMGLTAIRTISIKISKLATPLLAATSVISLASAFSDYRTFSKMRQLEKKLHVISSLDQSSDTTPLKCYQAYQTFIAEQHTKDQEAMALAFNCKPEKLLIRLAKIEKEATEKINSQEKNNQIEGKQLLNKTLKDLQGHIHHIGTSAAISSLTSVVSLVAGVALFFSPFAPLTYTIVGVGLALNIGNLLHHKIVEYQHAKNMSLPKKWHEWITC